MPSDLPRRTTVHVKRTPAERYLTFSLRILGLRLARLTEPRLALQHLQQRYDLLLTTKISLEMMEQGTTGTTQFATYA